MMKKTFKTLLLIASITLALFGCNKTKDKDIMFDYEILVRYIVDVLKGQLQDKYSSVEGRITIL